MEILQNITTTNLSGHRVDGSRKDGLPWTERVAAVLCEGVEDGENGGQHGEGRAQGAADLLQPPLHHLHPCLLPPPHLLLHTLLQEGALQDQPPCGNHYLVRSVS